MTLLIHGHNYGHWYCACSNLELRHVEHTLVLEYNYLTPLKTKCKLFYVLPTEISLFTVELAHYYKPTKISIGVYTQL